MRYKEGRFQIDPDRSWVPVAGCSHSGLAASVAPRTGRQAEMGHFWTDFLKKLVDAGTPTLIPHPEMLRFVPHPNLRADRSDRGEAGSDDLCRTSLCNPVGIDPPTLWCSLTYYTRKRTSPISFFINWLLLHGYTEPWVERALAILRQSISPLPTEPNDLDWKSGLSPKKDRLVEDLSAFANYPDGGFMVFGIDNSTSQVVGVSDGKPQRLLSAN